ncbi:GNAT family N-acetyltransferase [Streptomyces sp. NPDC054961]
MNAPAEVLGSGELELRRWRMGDIDVLDRTIRESLDHLKPWMPWTVDAGRPHTAKFLARSHEEWETGQGFGYAITSDGVVIGSCGLWRRIGPGGLDIGYWIHPGWGGRGLATKAAEALVDQGFRLADVDHVEIHHDAANTASGAVARRLGFTEIGRGPVPEGPEAPGQVGIDVTWRVTAEQWETRTAGNGERAV